MSTSRLNYDLFANLLNRYEIPKASTAKPRFTPAESAASLASLKARLDRKATPPKVESSTPKIAAETDLDDMFARLTSGSASPLLFFLVF